MICVYSAPTLPLVALLQEQLSAAGIRCIVRNQFLSGGAGEIPPHETWPQLCVLDPQDQATAHKLIAEYTDPSGFEKLPNWRCTHCGTSNEAIFDCCWNCQSLDTNPQQ